MKKNVSSKGKACKENESIQKVHKKYFVHEERITKRTFTIPTMIDYSIRTYVTDTTSDITKDR